MSILRQNRLAGLAVIGIPLMALVVAVVLLTWSSHGAGDQVGAAGDLAPAPGLDFSIAIDVDGDTTDDCDSTAGPTGCQLPNVGDSFTLKFYLNSLESLLLEPDYFNDEPDAFVQGPLYVTEKRERVTYVSPPLPEDLQVTGPPRVTFYASISVMDSVKQNVRSASMGFLDHPRSLQFLLFLQSKSVQENNRRAKTDVSIHT